MFRSQSMSCIVISPDDLTSFPCCLQSIQQDYTSLLSSLIRAFPRHSEFQDLVQLTDCHDPERDFFENMKHIQVKGNALPYLVFNYRL